MPGKRRYSLHRDSTKKCSQCGQYKNVAEFGWQNKDNGWKAAWCRECQKKKVYVHYKKKMKPINDYLKTHPCVDCGQSDYRVLEFDHVRGEKEFSIGNAWTRPWDEIQVEIDKCEVRCKNCHAIRHIEDGYPNPGPKITNEDYLDYLNDWQSNETEEGHITISIHYPLQLGLFD